MRILVLALALVAFVAGCDEGAKKKAKPKDTPPKPPTTAPAKG